MNNGFRSAEKKTGIKKYIFFGAIYVLMMYYCKDQRYYLTMAVTIIQTLLVIAAALIRKDVLPWNVGYRYPKLPTWLFVISLLLIIPFGMFVDRDQENSYSYSYDGETQTFTWPDSGLAQQLPEPVTNYGEIWEDTDLEFRIDMFNVSESRYKSYVKACKRRGFDDVNYESDSSFTAYNEEGYYLDLWRFDDGELDLTLQSPNKLETIEWPDSDLLTLLPTPDSLFGRIDADSSDYVAICVGNIWETEYKDYVDQCRSAGFKKHYERKSDMYQAEDENGNLLLLDFDEKLETMYIQIWSPEGAAGLESGEDGESVVTESESEEKDGTVITESVSTVSEEVNAVSKEEKESGSNK